MNVNTSNLQARIKPADVPLEKLAGNARLTEEQKVGEVARQFEAVLLRQILASARKTVVSSKINGSSSTSEVYQDMINDRMAEDISRSGAFGLARSFQHQLAHQVVSGTAADVRSLNHHE